MFEKDIEKLENKYDKFIIKWQKTFDEEKASKRQRNLKWFTIRLMK